MFLRQKNLLAFITTLLFVWQIVTTPANQNPDLEKTLLWKIEGNSIKPSYLFGTMHVLKQDDFKIKTHVQTALDASEQIVLELDMDDPMMAIGMMQHVAMREGKTIDQFLNEDEMKILDNDLKSSMGVGIAMFKSWMPVMTSSLMLKKVLGSEPASFEKHFMQFAQKKQLEILGLETVQEQLNVFHEIPYEKQADMLREYLNESDKMNTEFDDMTQMYLSEDISKLYTYAKDQFKKYDIGTNLMLDKRNMNWIPKIGEMAKSKVTFFAVGAGHLAGDKGVIQLLRENGYTVSPIMK